MLNNYNGEESGVHPQAPRIQYIVKEENAGCKPAIVEKFYSSGACKVFAYYYTQHVHLASCAKQSKNITSVNQPLKMSERIRACEVNTCNVIALKFIMPPHKVSHEI